MGRRREEWLNGWVYYILNGGVYYLLNRGAYYILNGGVYYIRIISWTLILKAQGQQEKQKN